MKRLLALLFAFVPPGVLAAPPRLVVVIVVDQLRPEAVDAAPAGGGFASLKKNGAVYSNARITHIPTNTAPGHATISTGRAPASHGIVGNSWRDKSTRKTVSSVQSAEHKAGPDQLMAPTLGDALKESNPRSKVVAVSGKDRGAVLMAGRRADAAIWYKSGEKRFVTSTAYPAPGWLDAFNAEHSAAPPKNFQLSAAFDGRLLELAERAIAEYALGADEHTDILWVSFSACDLIGHAHGPDSAEAREHLAGLDGILLRLLQAAGRASGDRAAVALTADHGVMPVPESPRGRAIGAKRVLRSQLEKDIGRALDNEFGGGNRIISSFLPPHVYLSRTGLDRLGISAENALPRVKRVIEKHPAIEAVFDPEHIDPGAPFADIVRRSAFPGRSGDLLIVFKRGVLVSALSKGTSHGSPHDYDARVPLLLMGAGVTPGVYNKPADVRSLAPTLAEAIGVDFERDADVPLLDALKTR